MKRGMNTLFPDTAAVEDMAVAAARARFTTRERREIRRVCLISLGITLHSCCDWPLPGGCRREPNPVLSVDVQPTCGIFASISVVLLGPIDPRLKILQCLIDQGDSLLPSPTPIRTGICEVSPGLLQAGYPTVHHAGFVDIAGLHLI